MTPPPTSPPRRSLVSQFNRLRTGPDVHRLNFDWLIRLRWVAFIGQSAVIIISSLVLHLSLPYPVLAVILLLEVLSNLALIAWARTSRPRHEAMGAVVLIADILFLTVLLHFTGGAANPFGLLYLIHVALAALVLRPLWTWLVTLISSAAFIGLHFFPDTTHYLPWATQPELWTLETQGRWVAFIVSAAVIAFFINMIQRALQRRDEELIRIRDAQLRDEKLASLATLAAGAAHEFSTPLSTIALVANELKHRLEEDEAPEDFIDDAALIRDQVERCREILRQMSADAGESIGELARTMTVGQLLGRILGGCRDPDRVDLVIDVDDATELQAPPTALTQALRGLVNNGIDASGPDQRVDLHVRDGAERSLQFQIRDRGVGMSQEVLERIDEPFFTTKEAGAGMGLGVFLARTLIEKLGGRLDFSSAPGQGTTTTVVLPLTPTLTSYESSEFSEFDAPPNFETSNPFEVFHE